MAALLSKGALALFAFTAFAPSATGPLAASASDIEIESERKLRPRGQGVKDSIQVDSVRRLDWFGGVDERTVCLHQDRKMLEVNSNQTIYFYILDECARRVLVDTFKKPTFSDQTRTRWESCVPEGRYQIELLYEIELLYANAFDLVSELNIEYWLSKLLYTNEQKYLLSFFFATGYGRVRWFFQCRKKKFRSR